MRVQWLADHVVQAVARFEKRWMNADGTFNCPANRKGVSGTPHDWGNYALAKMAAAPNDPATPTRVQDAIRCLFTFQSTADAATRGVFSFHYGDAPIARDNPTEFALMSLARLLPDHRLSPAFERELEPKLVDALYAIGQHHVCPGYTNICLLQVAELLSIGRVLGRSDDPPIADFGAAAVASGKAHLDDWLAFTRESGITEFDSLTYSQLDLEALLIALAGADDDATRTKIRAGLDYLWSDLAANYFAVRQSLAGPHSRTYSFYSGQGALSLSYYLEGLRTPPTDAHEMPVGIGAPVIDLLNARASLYQPPSRALCLSSAAEREVISTFGPDRGAKGRERYAFITRDFALGSTSADYDPKGSSHQDEMVRGELAGPSKTSAIVVLPDYFDAPGRVIKAGTFEKVSHLVLHPVAVQKKGTLLVLLDVPAKDPKNQTHDGSSMPLVNLATNIVVPADADAILLDGVAIDRQADSPASAHATIVVKIGTGAIAVSVIEASGIECPGPDGTRTERHPPSIRFKPFESANTEHGPTARLAVYHDSDLPADASSLAKCSARVALLWVGDHCGDADCASHLAALVADANQHATRAFNPLTGEWDVRVSVAGKPSLHVHRVVGEHESIVARDVDGQQVSFAPLQVNGQPVVLGP